MTSYIRRTARIALVAGAAFLIASPGTPQDSSAPIARYTMDAETLSGMAAMGAGGGGGLGAAMSMLRGGPQEAHTLILRLGSRNAATGAPKADHFMPDVARLGRSVPLETPRRGVETPATGSYELPQARLLLYWGCGERAPAGQPLVIDFSRLARGEIPPGLYAQGLDLPDDWRVTFGNSTTYGDWPNTQETRRLQANSSLLGAHRVASNYAPEISFNLGEDFMPALQPVGRDLPSGAVSMSWNALDKATGYYAWAIGTAAGGNSNDMVWWTSSATQAFGGPMAEWISPAAARRLVEARTLMPPSQTECTIPAEVKQAGGEVLMTSLFAYGPQADFVYPPRPDDARTAWRPEWIARVRFRSQAMMIPGMPAMGGMDFGDEQTQAGAQPQQPAKPRCRGLRGIAERAAGLCE